MAFVANLYAQIALANAASARAERPSNMNGTVMSSISGRPSLYISLNEGTIMTIMEGFKLPLKTSQSHTRFGMHVCIDNRYRIDILEI